MNDDLKQYAPTARSLARLRQAGLLPQSDVLTGALGLVVVTVGLVAAGPQLFWAARAMLARDLQQCASGLAWEALAGRLGWHLLAAVAVLLVLGAGAGLAATVARGLLTGSTGEGSGGRPWSRPAAGARRAGYDWAGLALVLPAGLAMAVLLTEAARRYGEAERWEDLLAVPLQAWWRWLAVLAGLALLHVLWVRAGYLQRARLSRRELVAEQKDTEPSDLTRRRQELLRRRR